MTRKEHEREIARLDAAYREAQSRKDKDAMRMLSREMARHAIQQHHGL
jgi:hypothetical protein